MQAFLAVNGKIQRTAAEFVVLFVQKGDHAAPAAKEPPRLVGHGSLPALLVHRQDRLAARSLELLGRALRPFGRGLFGAQESGTKGVEAWRAG